MQSSEDGALVPSEAPPANAWPKLSKELSHFQVFLGTTKLAVNHSKAVPAQPLR